MPNTGKYFRKILFLTVAHLSLRPISPTFTLIFSKPKYISNNSTFNLNLQIFLSYNLSHSDPNDVESPRNSFLMGSKIPIHCIKPPIDEELNLILGTMSGRGRSLPTTILPKTEESPTAKGKIANDVARRKKSIPIKER
jgi:hypothetical protein